jgi:iron-sulfur cluster assembly protein
MSFRVTPQTLDQLKGRLEQRGTGIGVQLSVTQQGCSGLAYELAFVDHVPSDCQCVSIDGLNLFVDEEAMVYLADSELDLVSHFPCHLFAGQQLSAGKRCRQQMTSHA